jgi:CheY-like chemotaxis protein
LARELRDLVKPLSFALENAKRADSDRCTTATAIEAIERQTTRIVRLVDHLRGLSCVSSDEQALREDASRPVAPEDEGPSVVPSAASAAAPKLSRRVLVVDDDHHCANSLVRLLKLDGHLTFVAHDGAEALDAVERHRPDVVFLDLGMPVLDGYEACRRLRERPYGKDLIIVALTAWGRASDRRKSKEAGFDGHFVKPANYDALAAVLDPGAARKTECA